MSKAVFRLEQQQMHLLDPSSDRRETGHAMRSVFTRNAAPPAGPYSQAIKAAGQVFCSGQLPTDPAGVLITGTVAEKTEACIRNLKAILGEAGSELGKVIFLSDMQYFQEMNAEYEKWFSHKPARSCVAVRTLPKNADVEIEAIAIQ
ncbi:endoribonuclease L-PSP [Capronia epimyces CBS 606.96]|uniref:Endoribonuclease L-PSP n=1 Tax=Capronia epimyces CBS 606.96 TaxID=1182542 RepID=W9YWN3_9EURO|nr:endoribonuclease L-PSP [Capronia epimyces CBS 606.96]EXJ86694.1 endoribonuclease L-PSP [Capronia epimyces CBS 606.96]